MKEAQVEASDVSVLVPHGLGILSHDRGTGRAENRIWQCVGKGRLRTDQSAKTASLAAGSGVDAATAVLSLHHGRIPAAINSRKIIDGQKLNVRSEVRDMKAEISVSSVYSLGGQNAALVFRAI